MTIRINLLLQFICFSRACSVGTSLASQTSPLRTASELSLLSSFFSFFSSSFFPSLRYTFSFISLQWLDPSSPPPPRPLKRRCLCVGQVFTDMPGGGEDGREEVVITGGAVVQRCPRQEGRRGDGVEPDYGRMQVNFMSPPICGEPSLCGCSDLKNDECGIGRARATVVVLNV